MTPPATTLEAPTTVPEVRGTIGHERKRMWEQVALALFIAVPFLAVLAAIPVAWGGWLGWRDVVIAVAMYAITGHGITVGFHRYFTHGSFKAKRPLKIALAVAAASRSRVRSSVGSPTTASTTSSATRTATRTRPGATARASQR
jgi:stearoyl-CoA desaturase (delta-9 desaturase)